MSNFKSMKALTILFFQVEVPLKKKKVLKGKPSFLEFFSNIVFQPFANGSKYSRMNQIKFVEGSRQISYRLSFTNFTWSILEYFDS